jgi:hypothetical protein
MKTEQEIRDRGFQINHCIREIIGAPGVGGSPEYERLYNERKALEWVLGDQI